MESLDLNQSVNDPHRSELSIPEFGGLPRPNSTVTVGLESSVREMIDVMGQGLIDLPLRHQISRDHQNVVLAAIGDFARGKGQISLEVATSANVDNVALTGDPYFFGRGVSSGGASISGVRISKSDVANSSGFSVEMNNIQSLNLAAYHHHFRKRIYRFLSDRKPGATCSASSSAQLDRTASNLPFVLNHLQTRDSHGHKLLCNWVQRIFPHIHWVQSTSIPNTQQFELHCLPTSPENRRDDLSVPISKMGTGIGNVLSILYVVLTSRHPQVIAIDEPNAFLHPRALRELLSILESEGSQHQYILSAHSADVLTAIKTKTISHLDFDGRATNVKQINAKELHTIRGELAQLGIRVSDLHAKDVVLWVEGQSEELVLPDLLRWACPELAAGIAVLRVERTGTFSKKKMDIEEVVAIYERLSTSSSLVPPMICIPLDGENRTEREKRALSKKCSEKLKFLSRRMLENFLLHEGAITHLFAALGIYVESERVTEALVQNLNGLSLDSSSVDGAKILSAIVSSLSDATQEFRKTRDVPELVDWLLTNEPDFLNPLRTCLREVVELSP